MKLICAQNSEWNSHASLELDIGTDEKCEG